MNDNNNREITHAAIDIGSNSVKIRVGRLSGSGNNLDILLDTTEVVKLGRFENNRIVDSIMNNAVRVVSEMVRRARELGAEPKLVGTMALRTAENANVFLDRIHNETGAEVKIISGTEEASYSWKGTISGLRDLDLDTESRDIIAFDTGGGSTEFVFGRGRKIIKSQSLPIGAVTLSAKFFAENITRPVRDYELEAAMSHVQEILSRENITRSPELNTDFFVIGIGGGVVSMASVKNADEKFLPLKLHGMKLTQRDLKRQLKLYAALTVADRRDIIGLPPSRADVILGSACIVFCVLKALAVNSFTVSINGLRHGVLLDLFERDGYALL